MKVFYDLGTHLFEGLLDLYNVYHFNEDWKIYCFEPNPYTYIKAKEILKTHTVLKNLNIELLNVAVLHTDGISRFHCHDDDYCNMFIGVGSRITYNLDTPYVNVETVCLSNFIRKNYIIDDEIYIKMDIEGSEFVTIEDLIQTNTHLLIKKIFIEWHDRFWSKDQATYINWKNNLMSRLIDDNINVDVWL